MAPKHSTGPVDHAKVKVRFIEFELEGGNTAVENSVKNLTHALSHRNGGTTPHPKQLAAGKNGGASQAAEEEAVTVEAQVDESAEAEATTEAAAASGVAKSRSPRKLPTPEVIDIDLTSGSVPFKEYCEAKRLENDWHKYLACAGWLKEHRNTPTVTGDHIYTMFKFMKWPIPADVTGPLRSMKRQGWFTLPERGKYAINHIGENELNQLPSS